MKKRGKNLFCLWLALMLTVVSVPTTVQLQAAGSSDAPAITHQPTEKEPYVTLNREGAAFSWHKAEPTDCLVVSSKKKDDQIEASAKDTSYNSVIEGWEAPDGLLELNVPAKKNDFIMVTPCNGFAGTVKDGSGNAFTDKGNGTYTHDIAADGTFSIHMSEKDSRSFWTRVEITRLMPAGKVEGQNSDTFTGEPGTYICVISLTDRSTVNSDPLKVSAYDITTSSAGNGGCRIQIGEKEVSSATPGQKVTVMPEPADTYELDTITVTKKDSSNTQVTVRDNSFIMPDYPVIVHVTFRRASYHITLPSGTGYHAASQQPTTADYGINYIFTVTLEEGYEVSNDFSVTSNNTVLTPTSINGNTYTYTLYHIAENQIIRVSGIKRADVADTQDNNPPEVTIMLNKDTVWKDLKHLVSFNTFFNKNIKLTISVKDPESGVKEKSVRYYLANRDLFTENKVYTAQEIEQRIPSWTEYKGAVMLPGDKTYVLYARAEDNNGNISYASTTGIIIDTTAPTVERMKKGKAFYGNSTFTIRDHYLEKVVVDGKSRKVSGSSHTVTIPADNRSHTIFASDRAGNPVSYQFYVNETWMRDGISISGTYSLRPDNSYKLCSGKWKVSGDNTVYEGNRNIYVSKDSNYDFKKQ